MKNFVKALDTKDREFAFLHQKFQQKSMEKIKAGIFDGPQIRELIKDTSFHDALNPAELSAWLSLSLSLQTSLATTEFPSIGRWLMS